jgi:hypothetical protein
MSRPDLRPGRFVGVSLLLLALLLAGPAHAEYLGNVSFDIASPSFLPHDARVYVSIDYKIDVPEGRRIYVIPYTGGAPTPGYAVQGSPVYPQGTGTATSYFTIQYGEVLVDHLRVYTRDPDFTETPLELFVPVNYRFGPHGVYDVQPDHAPYSRLPHGTDLTISFSYGVDAPGCKIYARPWNGSHLEPGYAASGSADLPPSGSYSQHFSFDGDADISHIRFQVFALDNTTLLAEFFVPWDCHWREWGLYDISFNRDMLSSVHNSQQTVASFTIDHEVPEGVRVWVWCIQDGEYCPGSSFQGSVLEPTGPHAITRYARVASGSQTVDHIRFLVGQVDEYYLTFDVPLRLDYGPHALQDIEFAPASPAILSPDERLEMTFSYLTDEAAGVHIFGRAALDGAPLFGMTSAGSPLYPAPSGTGDFWLSYDSDTVADSIRLQMVSDDQSQLFLEWFEPGHFVWASSGTVTPAAPPAADTILEPCYPNPFNPTTTIPVNLARAAAVRLSLYDVRGRLVRTLHDGPLAAGQHLFSVDGRGMSSGTYVCRLQTPRGTHTQRLTLVR